MDRKRQQAFQCTRCGFAAAVEMPVAADRDFLALFPCPLCQRHGSRVGFALRTLGLCVLLGIPLAFVAFIFVLVAMLDLYRVHGTSPLAVAVAIVAALLVPVFVRFWLKAHGEAKKTVKLRRFWEWQLPAGPRIVAVQDPGSDDDAVWIDGVRAAASETGDGYLIQLHAARDGDPYRATGSQAKLVFPAKATCWLTLGGKRIEPVRTSSDVV